MAAVVRCAALGPQSIAALAARFGVEAVPVAAAQAIPGSYWGAPEAGLAGQRIYFRDDTPAHSLLHELCHFICMTPPRRAGLDTDAGGDDDEECAVCYLSILLAPQLTGYDAARCLADMDAWGYSFREGSAGAWFGGDGRDARRWLRRHALIDRSGEPRWRCRGDELKQRSGRMPVR